MILIKIILVLVAIYYGIKFVARLLFRRAISKMQEQVQAFQTQQEDMFRQQYGENPFGGGGGYEEQTEDYEPSDDVKVKHQPKQIQADNKVNRPKTQKRQKPDDDYIDFEEV